MLLHHDTHLIVPAVKPAMQSIAEDWILSDETARERATIGRYAHPAMYHYGASSWMWGDPDVRPFAYDRFDRADLIEACVNHWSTLRFSIEISGLWSEHKEDVALWITQKMRGLDMPEHQIRSVVAQTSVRREWFRRNANRVRHMLRDRGLVKLQAQVYRYDPEHDPEKFMGSILTTLKGEFN